MNKSEQSNDDVVRLWGNYVRKMVMLYDPSGNSLVKQPLIQMTKHAWHKNQRFSVQ